MYTYLALEVFTDFNNSFVIFTFDELPTTNRWSFINRNVTKAFSHKLVPWIDKNIYWLRNIMDHWLYHCHLWLIKVHWFRDFLLIHLPLMPYQHWQHTKNFSCGLIRWNIEYIRSLTSKCISNLQYKIRHYFLKTGIHSMQGWTATTGHGATRKRSTKILKHTRNHAIYQNNK